MIFITKKKFEKGINKLWIENEINKELIKKLEKYVSLNLSDNLSEDSYLFKIYHEVEAIKKFLDIETTWVWEDDQNCLPSKPKQKRSCKVRKIIKK